MCQQRSALLTSTDRTSRPTLQSRSGLPARLDHPIGPSQTFTICCASPRLLSTLDVNFLTFQLARIRPLVAKSPTKRLTGRITARAIAKTNRSLSWSS
jgi:hypothetical protein